jgi:hypothetical protein
MSGFRELIGQPRVQNFRARFRGRIRSGPDARWMSFTGEQHNFFDQPSRLFLMDAAMFGVPFQAFHRFVGPEATMRVKVASVFTMVDARGPQMDAAETVTLFNDLCVMAPGAMVDPAIVWQQVDAHTVYGTFTNAGRTVRAVLTFNDLGESSPISSPMGAARWQRTARRSRRCAGRRRSAPIAISARTG